MFTIDPRANWLSGGRNTFTLWVLQLPVLENEMLWTPSHSSNSWPEFSNMTIVPCVITKMDFL